MNIEHHNPHLIVHNLKKTYPNGAEAVKGVDFDAGRGEFIVLLGPSGCGKTTTLRMLAGLEMPDTGSIQLDGKDITRLRPAFRDVGFVFQFYALYPHMTAEKNIRFPLENMGVGAGEIDEKINALASRMDIKDLLPRHPRHLSGGDQQRVALARAMIRQPGLFLMDEPLGTLDADRRLEMREFIREQQNAVGVTTVYVTHDQEEAMALADRIIVMRNGFICQNDTPEAVYETPADTFVARFVGSPGMNLFDGIAGWDENRPVIRPRSGGEAFDLGETGARSLPEGPVTMGIRPEYVHITDRHGMAGRVTRIEFFGGYGHLHTETAFGRITVRTDHRPDIKEDVPVFLRLDFEHLRFFDQRTGQALDRLNGETGL